MNKIKEALKLGLVFPVVFFVTFLVFQMPKAQAATDASLSFLPAGTSVANGSDFSLTVRLDPGSHHVNGVFLRTSFDHAKLNLDSINVSGSFPTFMAPTTISNSDGTARVDVGTSYGAPPYNITSPMTFATFNFHAVGAGTSSPVAFTTGTQVMADDTGNNNDLGTKTNRYGYRYLVKKITVT